jgi:chromosome transmission fidelity protein 1
MEDEGNKDQLPTPGWPRNSDETSLELKEASKAFHFPYPVAYKIQIDLMQAVFRTIELGKIGLFESPTGTVSCY